MLTLALRPRAGVQECGGCDLAVLVTSSAEVQPGPPPTPDPWYYPVLWVVGIVGGIAAVIACVLLHRHLVAATARVKPAPGDKKHVSTSGRMTAEHLFGVAPQPLRVPSIAKPSPTSVFGMAVMRAHAASNRTGEPQSGPRAGPHSLPAVAEGGSHASSVLASSPKDSGARSPPVATRSANPLSRPGAADSHRGAATPHHEGSRRGVASGSSSSSAPAPHRRIAAMAAEDPSLLPSAIVTPRDSGWDSFDTRSSRRGFTVGVDDDDVTTDSDSSGDGGSTVTSSQLRARRMATLPRASSSQRSLVSASSGRGGTWAVVSPKRAAQLEQGRRTSDGGQRAPESPRGQAPGAGRLPKLASLPRAQPAGRSLQRLPVGGSGRRVESNPKTQQAGPAPGPAPRAGRGPRPAAAAAQSLRRARTRGLTSQSSSSMHSYAYPSLTSLEASDDPIHALVSAAHEQAAGAQPREAAL